MSSSTGGGQSRSLILTAMIFAVAMTFIDQTIVSIAAPTIQHDLGLSSSGMQWAINAYLLTLALFFGIAGGLTAIGPIAGGYLIEWTWRAIFWINIPVALIALALIAISRPPDEARPAPMDYRGLALIVGGVGLSVFGFQQSALWGWGNPAIEASIVAGVVLLVVFYFVERRTESPLINVRIFENRTFLVENVILGIAMMAFIPVFFFAAIYGQIALAEKATQFSLLILYFFIGFVVCAQIGGRMLDRIGAKRPVVLGCALAAAGFGLWAGKVTDLH